MKRSVAFILGFLFLTMPSWADEITDTVNVAEKIYEEASKTTDAKLKSEKHTEAKVALTKTIDKITASKKIYTDQEIAPLYQYRGIFNFELREYEQALADFTVASKLNPDKITPWINLSWIKTSAPIEKLRDGKEALKAAEKAFASLKAYAAKVPNLPVDKFQHSITVIQFREKCGLATAAAYAEMGNVKEAIRYIKDGDEKTAKEYLDQYRDGKPYRLPAKK